MAAKVVICLVLLTSIMANGFTPNYKYHEGKHHHTHKHSTENEKADILHSKNETTTTPPLIEREGKTIEVFNDTQATNTTEEIASTTESSQKVTKEDIDTASSQLYVSYSPPTYEVHENVIDVPDDRTPSGPIITNYTKPKVLNTVRPNDSTTTINTDSTPIGQVTEENIKKKDIISILHVKVETEEKHKESNKESGLFKGIKDYFSGLHKGFLNSIHNIFHKKDGHTHRLRRSPDNQYPRNENRGRQNSDNVDKTDFFVRRQHISLT